MQDTTREIAFTNGWTKERAAQVASLFDGLADTWRQGAPEALDDALSDALARGGASRRGLAIEVGSGTGVFTRLLDARFERVLALDISFEMLRRAPSIAARVCTDASALPLRDGAVNTLVLANCFLFPAEVDRVLAAKGTLLWVSTLAGDTPIYLGAEEIEEALPGAWRGRGADAGWGSWVSLSRA
jgi:ubiquinone/menaquinone biosynthesis C-methylase UbiE